MFSGSYRPNDVYILLKPIHIEDTPIAQKEYLIQSGQRHYSELLSREQLPSERYMQVFNLAFEQNRERMARDLLQLARLIAATKQSEITLVSLARAGTPIGVILKHILQRYYQRNASHYSISIIRDRGIDSNALRYILTQGHADSSIVFVDGWTGKGVITCELKNSIAAFNQTFGVAISPDLYVLADLAGSAAIAASAEDYLIPSSILNATISGLISRSILNRDYIQVNDFHGCVYYQEFSLHDLSMWFVHAMLGSVDRLAQTLGLEFAITIDKQSLQITSKQFINTMMTSHHVHDVNRIKPGIGEATRVLLRRVPDLLILRNQYDEAIQHLLILAEEKNVRVLIDPDLPYQAAALIKEVLHD
jgi:hypothetical protein